MEFVSVKVQIGDKEYPMRVKEADQERVMRTAEALNDQINQMKTRFGAVDKQDLYAMLAFDAWFEKLQAEDKEKSLLAAIGDELDNLANQIDG